MATLHQHLATTPRRMLLAIARARGLPVAWDAPRSELVTALADVLLDLAQLNQTLRSLSRAERAVLEDLIMVGGRLPRHHVVRRHGDLRPYRPWRSDAPRRPWENPISPVERLWFLALVFHDQSADDLIIPDDVLPHLPAPEQAPPSVAPGQQSHEPALVAVHDLGYLLALLQANDVRPRHGRWLPPRPLSEWGQRCVLSPVFPEARGELQTGRRRYLHYLAERAGFVGLAGPYLKPTPAAWLWLEAPPVERLNTLWNAFATPDPALWRTYRLPGHDLTAHSDKLVAAIIQTLPKLGPADPATLAGRLLAYHPSLYDLLPPNLADPRDELTSTIVELLTGALVWLGALSAESQGDLCSSSPPLRLTVWGASWLGVTSPPPEVPPPPLFSLSSTDPDNEQNGVLAFTLTGGLPDPADLMVLMEVGSREYGVRGARTGEHPILAEETDVTRDQTLATAYSLLPTSYHITAASFARALHQGWSPQALLDALNRLAERPLTGQETALLRTWAEAAGRTTIRRLTVLETSDPDVISRLASTRRGRELIVRSLSPRAVVVDEARLEQLVRRLTRQEGVPPEVVGKEYGVGSRSDFLTPYSILPTPNSSGAGHAWLTLKVYQGLGRFMRLAVRTPQALLDSLSSLADPHYLAAAETAAESTLAALQDVIDGRVAFPPWPKAGLPVEESLAIVEQALAAGHLLEMDYYTAGRDALTHRMVEPYRLEWRGDVPYLVGFCHRAQAERVFRVDRVRGIKVVKSDADWE